MTKQTHRPLTIGQAARLLGVNVETIRYYQRRGLIQVPERAHGSAGTRDYSGDCLARLRFIRQAKAIGFSLREIADLLALQTVPGAGCADVRRQAEAKRADVQQRLHQLEQIRDQLDRLIARCPGEGALGACTILDIPAK